MIHRIFSEPQYLYHDSVLSSSSLKFDMIQLIAVWHEILRNVKWKQIGIQNCTIKAWYISLISVRQCAEN